LAPQISAVISRIRAIRRSSAGARETANIAASICRAAGRGLWGLALPWLLPVEAFGRYSLLQTSYLVSAQVGALGLPQVVMREQPGTVPLLGLFLHSAFLAVVVALVMGVLGTSGSPMAMLLVPVAAVVTVGYLVSTARAKARLRFASVLRAEAFGTGVFVLGIALGWLGDVGRHQHAVEMAVVWETGIGAALIGVLYLVSRGAHGNELSLRGTFRHLKPIYLLGSLSLFDALFMRRADVLFIQRSPAGLVGVAVFTLGVQLANMALLVPGATSESWLPLLARSYRDDRSAFLGSAKVLRRRLTLVYSISVVVLGAGMILAVAGFLPKYRPALLPIAFFFGVRFFVGFTGSYSMLLYATKNERWLVPISLGGAFASITLHSLLTVRYGMVGAAVAFGAANLAVGCATILVVRRVLRQVARDCSQKHE